MSPPGSSGNNGPRPGPMSGPVTNTEDESDLGATAMLFGAATGAATHVEDNLPARLRGYVIGHPDRPPVLALFLTHPTCGRVRVFVPCGAFDSPGSGATPPAPTPDLLAASERNT